MAEKVAKTNIQKESGYLYFIDKDGDVSKAQMSRGKVSSEKKAPEKVSKCSISKESGYLYFVDKDGDVSKAKMSRGRS